MSSDVIARVHAFATKAAELMRKGHLLRAAENYGRAGEAAHALGADNLVALQMRMLRANMLAEAVAALDDTADEPRVTFLSACRTECIALLSGAVDALERRRAADTLLEGKCTSAEAAWRAKETQLKAPHIPAAVAVSLAAMYGYEQVMHAAENVAIVLSVARAYAAECSGVQFHAFAQFVVHAAELMQQPRRHEDVVMGNEANFVSALRYAAANAGASGLDARLVQLIASAWQQLQRSGVLQTRRIEEAIQCILHTETAYHAAIQSSLNAPDLRSCALPGCGAKEAHPTHFKSCAACRTVVYCCREHQVAGWPSHKKACKAAHKASEDQAEDEAGPSGA